MRPTAPADNLSDAALLAAARDGDDLAFGTLVSRHARAAYLVALAVVDDPDLAEDVCQETLFRLWRRLEDCRESDRFAAWLARSVRRQALNALRGRRRAEPIEDLEVATPGPSPDLAAEQGERREHLEAALRHLSPEQRQAVTLFDLEGWPHARIAETLETTVSMSRQHLMLGRRRLRALLGRKEDQP